MKNVFLLLLFIPIISFSQSNTQSVRGNVTDKQSQSPLIGVKVQITELQFVTFTDSLGNYEIGNIPPNRYEINVSYLGYNSQNIPNVVVTSGKQVILDIALEESFVQLTAVEIEGNSKEGTINKMASVSTRTFSMEEVNRYAGGRSDPARLAANFAGVSAPDDSRNDIVIRGNSPVGVLWRIDGMNVTNPNHFASVGTTGGAVSALNTNLLKNSDFFTSAFPSEYGNATAGVFDLGFRNGNNQKHETTFQVGVITGLELTTEGPLNKKGTGSYVIGYRYALAGVAQALGVDIGTTATPSYQDLSFKLNLGTNKLGKFSMFGILANSTIKIGGGNDGSIYGNGNQVDFGSEIGIVGFKHTKQINSKSFINSSIGLNYSSTEQTSYDFDRFTRTEYSKEINNFQKTALNFNTNYNLKLNSRVFFKAGVQNETIDLDLYYKTKVNINSDYTQIWDSQNTTNFAQAFSHLKYSLTEKLTMNAGIHSQVLFLNNTSSVEPRLGLVYNLNNKSSLNFGYGLHSQMQPINVYFLQNTDENGNISYSNKELDFTKSHHVVLGYNIQPIKDWRVKAEVYYQSIFNVPVNTFESTYSMLNTGATFKTDLEDSLTNAGTGENYGVELTIEKFFSTGYYGLFTSSLYSSTYVGSDGVERNTAFNGRYVFNLLGGKEWKVGKDNRNALSADLKFITQVEGPIHPLI